MKELSIFVDESGDWGEYKAHSPYYIISFIFHDQSVDIHEELTRLENDLKSIGYSGHCLHAGPIIRGEEYSNKKKDIHENNGISQKNGYSL